MFRPGTMVLVLCVALVAFASPAAAQGDVILDRLPMDVTVRVVDAATGETVRAERVLVREPGPIQTTVAESFDVDGTVTFEGLMLHTFKPYVVSAWVQGVAYHAQQNGQAFLDGQEITVHAFPQSEDLAGVIVTGMNVVVRRQESGFDLEYVLQIENRSRPQRTIPAGALPVQLALPPGLERTVCEVRRGPDPLTGELQATAGGLHGVAMDLPPGPARVTVRGLLTAERIEVPVAVNLPVEAWSLLAWPASLEVRSFDLERDRDSDYPEFSRWKGPALEPGQRLNVSVAASPDAAGLAVAEPDATEPRPVPSTSPQRRRFPWLTLIAAVVLMTAYIAWRRRR